MIVLGYLYQGTNGVEHDLSIMFNVRAGVRTLQANEADQIEVVDCVCESCDAECPIPNMVLLEGLEADRIERLCVDKALQDVAGQEPDPDDMRDAKRDRMEE